MQILMKLYSANLMKFYLYDGSNLIPATAHTLKTVINSIEE